MSSTDKERLDVESRKGDDEETSPVVVVLVTVAIVVASVALILAIVAMSNNRGKLADIEVMSGGAGGNAAGQTGGGTAVSGQGNDDRIWQLSFEHTGNNYGYIDDATGELRGFQIDLTTAVCQIAGKSCQLVYDSPNRCWDSQVGARAQGGEGLMAQYYDGCVGWVQAYDRPRTFKFTTAYSYPIKTVFMVQKGSTGFNWRDLTGATIGFVDGWAYDEHCIAREKKQITGWDLTPDQIVRYSGRDELLEGLLNDEVDAIFDNASGWIATADDRVTIVSDAIESCARDGLSVMMRKDNQLDTWWNPAFETLKQTSQWRSVCNDLLDEHGHRGGPQPEDFCVDL